MTDTYRPDMLLNELCENYINENPRIRSPHTRSLMKTSVQNFNNFIGRAATIADLTNTNLVAFMECRKALGRSPRTIEREVSKMATLWRWAAGNHWCDTPRFSIAKCKPPSPTAWTPAEIKQIFKGAAEYKSTIGGLPANVVLVAVLRLCYDTGERSSALLAVKWTDIDLVRRWVTFRAETRKGGARASDNVQRLSRKTAKALRALHDECNRIGKRTDEVFPQMHRTSFYGHLKSLLTLLNLPSDRSCMFHKLRRTHATHLYVLGGDATASLGHDSDVITRGYYYDPRQTRGSYLADLGGGLFGLVARLWRRALATVRLW
jgi:integrase